MDMGIDEFRELIRIRENVGRHVKSLELCWSCQRVSECKLWLENEAAPVWLCGDCLAQLSCRQEEFILIAS